ncbi:hypothetical protein [Synechococcus sp. CC9616]|uniref:hypothetical protein n=1 Tax=Synechococcus sp. CC9616 TaxID=110663 RepID=UPI00048E7A5C|nr:hypothetical protein [Synechococcus sp. CC9616]
MGAKVDDNPPENIFRQFNLGVLERFGESMVVFEWLLLQQGISVNFAYPGRKNKSKTGQQHAEHSLRYIDDALKMNCFLKDFERRCELA